MSSTHIIILVDVSYSMLSHISDFVKALNNFVDKLKNENRYYKITVGQFNTHLDYINVFTDLNSIRVFQVNQFNIYGTTALYDAIYNTITNVSTNHQMKNMNTQMYIISDGDDNASKYKKEDADNIMNNVMKQYNWKIIHCHTDLNLFSIPTINYDINDICDIFNKIIL